MTKHCSDMFEYRCFYRHLDELDPHTGLPVIRATYNQTIEHDDRPDHYTPAWGALYKDMNYGKHNGIDAEWEPLLYVDDFSQLAMLCTMLNVAQRSRRAREGEVKCLTEKVAQLEEYIRATPHVVAKPLRPMTAVLTRIHDDGDASTYIYHVDAYDRQHALVIGSAKHNDDQETAELHMAPASWDEAFVLHTHVEVLPSTTDEELELELESLAGATRNLYTVLLTQVHEEQGAVCYLQRAAGFTRTHAVLKANAQHYAHFDGLGPVPTDRWKSVVVLRGQPDVVLGDD